MKSVCNVLLCIVYMVALTSFAVRAADEKPKDAPAKEAPVKDEKAARAAFEADYDAGVAALDKKDWPEVKKKMESALKALGDFAHAKKTTAQILQSKADRAIIKVDALFTANELVRLKQWVEAEEAFRRVVDVSGETETLRKAIVDCRTGLEAENEGLKKAGELLRDHKYKEAGEAYNKVSDSLGGIRAIRDGLNNVQLGIELEGLQKRGPEQLKEHKWDEAFNTYKRMSQIVGENDEVRKGAAAAQAGYAEEHKPAEKVEGAPPKN